ncbi:hypothetical protein [Klebsiella oxytoca]|uniref:Uncharacterized protein n=1 Tax=Klebsiella oxytoca TaxID=571 RepID=A0A6B8MMC9_KLEOX|nr:hypothetical protein [Klebsiella oxytoca]QGN37512.1 hypothetical protein GJ746_09405 [Klebsiella oxytoca]
MPITTREKQSNHLSTLFKSSTIEERLRKYFSDKKLIDNGVGECVNKSIAISTRLLLFSMFTICLSPEETGSETTLLASSFKPNPGLLSIELPLSVKKVYGFNISSALND